MTQELRVEIERHVEAGRLFDRHDEPDLSEDKTGFLRVARGNRRGELSLTASDASSSELRSILEGLVSRAVDRPVSALRLQAKARFDGPNVKVRTRLVQLGEQPIAVGVTDAHDPLKLRVILERGGRLVDEQQLGPEDLTRLVAKKQLPSGWHTVAPGSPWTLVPFLIRSPNDRERLFARVEATLRVRTKGRAPIVIELTSPSVSVEYEEEVDQ